MPTFTIFASMKIRIAAIIAAALLSTGCMSKLFKEFPDSGSSSEWKYVNLFAFNTIKSYYLWIDEPDVASEMNSWVSSMEPLAKVKQIRHKDSSGQEIDRWTQLTNDYESFIKSVDGTSKTYGYDFILMYVDESHARICAVITYVYPGTPAAKAGLKRGDAIMTVNGKAMTPDNYYELANNELHSANGCKIGMHNGDEHELTPVEMCCDPVLVHKTFDCGAKKVGYLLYMSYTRDSYQSLAEAMKQFKADGVTELILDLRYNTGGYTVTAQTLSSMLAPAKCVQNGDVYLKEVYNSTMAAIYGDEPSRFKTNYSFTDNGKSIKYDITDALLAPEKIYVLTGSNTASASEATVCGLSPYVPITLIGAQSHGKYCSGVVTDAESFFKHNESKLSPEEYQKALKDTHNWGLYVMLSRYSDANGVTRCMPNGLKPDIEAKDNPIDGYQLGDPEESLLKIALTKAGYNSSKAGYRSTEAGAPAPSFDPTPLQPEHPSFFIK